MADPPLINFGDPEPLMRSSRWAPKPEQIMILESIFGGGMVNPSKDETNTIRKMLQKYGPVGDTNVFYWFQNRRSRCRRRQRKNMESERGGGGGAQPRADSPDGGGHTTQLDNNNMAGSSSSSSYAVDGSGYTSCNNFINTYDDFFRCLGPQSQVLQQYDQNHNPEMMNYHPEIITVFINGVATDVKRERLHVTNIFAGEFVMYDSSGIPLQVDHKGFLVQCLEHGQNYYLVATLSS